MRCVRWILIHGRTINRTIGNLGHKSIELLTGYYCPQAPCRHLHSSPPKCARAWMDGWAQDCLSCCTSAVSACVESNQLQLLRCATGTKNETIGCSGRPQRLDRGVSMISRLYLVAGIPSETRLMDCFPSVFSLQIRSTKQKLGHPIIRPFLYRPLQLIHDP